MGFLHSYIGNSSNNMELLSQLSILWYTGLFCCLNIGLTSAMGVLLTCVGHIYKMSLNGVQFNNF